MKFEYKRSADILSNFVLWASFNIYICPKTCLILLTFSLVHDIDNSGRDEVGINLFILLYNLTRDFFPYVWHLKEICVYYMHLYEDDKL